MPNFDVLKNLQEAESDFGEQLVLRGDASDEERVVSFTRRWQERFVREFETNQWPRIKENFQLFMLRDEMLEWMAVQGKKNALRSKIVLPKMQPELFTRIANELAMIGSASPVWRCLAPKDASDALYENCQDVEAGINDFLDADEWYYTLYAIKFWASLASYVPVEIIWAEERRAEPTGDYEEFITGDTDGEGYFKLDSLGRQRVERRRRMAFQTRTTFVGPKTKWHFPWDCFFDYTAADLEKDAPLLFRRQLLSTEQVLEKIEAREWMRPKDDDWEKTGGFATGAQGVGRNYLIELLNSVPSKGMNVSGMWQMEKPSRKHEILLCYAEFYDPDTDQLDIYAWEVLNRKYLLSRPKNIEHRRLRIPYLIVRSRPIPGTLLGMPPAESLKQIQRLESLIINLALKGVLYHLGPITLLGQGINFQNPDVILHPQAFIPMSGQALQGNVHTIDYKFSPDSLFQPLGIIDQKGQQVSDTSDRALGVSSTRTPPSAFQVGEEEKGRGTKLGLFVQLDVHTFLKKWAEMFYWTAMEKNPVTFLLRGKANDLRNWVIPGGPVFDLPQVGEVAGRISEKAQLQASLDLLMKTGIFFNPAIGREITEQEAPRLYALVRRYGRAMGMSFIEEVLQPPVRVKEGDTSSGITPQDAQMLAAQREQAAQAEDQMALELMKLAQTKNAQGGANGQRGKPAVPAGSR